jgi:hypothetical protein
MPKFATPSTIVNCPICGFSIDRKRDEHGLAKHLQSDHANMSLKHIAQLLEDRLGLSHADNLDKTSNSELGLYIESLCQYVSTTRGLKRVRRNPRRFEEENLLDKGVQCIHCERRATFICSVCRCSSCDEHRGLHGRGICAT